MRRDARFNATVCEALYLEYPEDPVKELAEKKNRLVSNAGMAKVYLGNVCRCNPLAHHEEQIHAEGTLFEYLFFRIGTETGRKVCARKWMQRAAGRMRQGWGRGGRDNIKRGMEKRAIK